MESKRFKKGNIPWNKEKKGLQKHSDEFKLRLSKIQKAKGTKPPSNKGIPHSENTKRKISIANKGKKRTLEMRKKLRETWTKTREKRSRENHWHWQNKTPLNIQIKLSFQYRQWRSDIFTRDDFTCQECGSKNKKIEAHHKKRFAIILNEYHIKTFEEALVCEELWNINNGQTLCNDCHRKTGNYGDNKI